jgi:enediyne polyketide synthase
VALARVLVRETGEGEDAAATRVWAAAECLKKAGVPGGTPLTLAATAADGWGVLAAGSGRVATLAASVRGVAERLVLAVFAEDSHAGV